MQVTLPGPAGRLEGLLWQPRAPARAGAIVCHPHPLYGGTMHNHVVFRIARALRAAGLAVLRFNFRGAGASEGVHDGGPGEVQDARAALDFLAERLPDLPLWAAGFSFGSRTLAALAGEDERIQELLLVALPCKAFDCSAILRVRPPTWVLLAGRDEFGTLADLRARFPVLPAQVVLEEIEGVDHFFRGATPELEKRVLAAAQARLP
jgi:alpha/beta superfamily hydrolase